MDKQRRTKAERRSKSPDINNIELDLKQKEMEVKKDAVDLQG